MHIYRYPQTPLSVALPAGAPVDAIGLESISYERSRSRQAVAANRR